MKCKNIECKEETIGKRIYCSLTCRNIFVNKHLRSYDKLLNLNIEKRVKKLNYYLKYPKKCLFCSDIIQFEFRRNKYCSHSCSASHTNKNRIVTWNDRISDGIKKRIIEGGKFGALLHINYVKIEIKNCPQCFKGFSKKSKFCNNECRKKFNKENVDSYQQYRTLTNFNFNLSDYPDEFDFTLVSKHGWYSPSNKKNNLNGISRDHMLSVREGFELDIDPKLISHPANCKLMIHSENISKNRKSTITLDELLCRIEIFEEKYKISNSLV